MNKIRIDVGVHTSLYVDLTEFDFTGIERVILTIKNKYKSDALIIREFTESGNHSITIKPEESILLGTGAIYDFDVITTDGKRFKASENGSVELRKGVGTWKDENSSA